MKFGLIVIVTLLIGAIAANYLVQDVGYVAIQFRGYLVEMSVPALIVIAATALFAIWLVMKVFRAPRKLGEAVGRYKSGRAGQRLTRGVIEVAEGNFARGERLLARAAGVSEAPLLNYLQAARAAHLLGQDERRDAWLKQAYETLPGATNAVLLTQAELQLDQQQYEQALATLRQIEENSPNHGHALTLLGRLYFRLEDWEHLGQLLPRLKKHGRLDPQTFDAWSVRVHVEKLKQAADGMAVAEAWKDVPREYKNDIDVVAGYFAALIRTGEHDRAEKDLSAELKRSWRAPLVRLYGLVEGSEPERQLKRAEGWLRNHGEDPDLFAGVRKTLHTAGTVGQGAQLPGDGYRPAPDARCLPGIRPAPDPARRG